MKLQNLKIKFDHQALSHRPFKICEIVDELKKCANRRWQDGSVFTNVLFLQIIASSISSAKIRELTTTCNSISGVPIPSSGTQEHCLYMHDAKDTKTHIHILQICILET